MQQGAETKGRKRRNSQDRIFRAAVTVLARRGYHDTRITDIATHAGVAYGLVYHYFGSKQNILDVILNEVGLRFNERLDRIFAEDLPVREKLGRVSDFMFDSYLANEDVIHLLVKEVVHGPGTDRRAEIASGLVKRISDMIRQGMETARLDSHVEPQVLALSFFGSVQMLLTALVADYYDRGGQKKVAVIKSLKAQMRHLLLSTTYGR